MICRASTCKLGLLEPACRELIAAIGHELAAEHAEAKHLGRRQIRFEFRIEVSTNRLDAFVVVIPLHPIIDCGRPSHIAAGTDIDDQKGTAELSHSLLCNLLQSAGVAGSPIEYGGQEDERTWRRGHGFGDHQNYFLHYAHRPCVTSNGVFSAKMMFAQMTSFVADLKRYKAIDAGEMIDTIDVAFGMPRYVQMLRRDKERQAISFVRAAQSGAWNWIEAPRAQPNYDPALLERAGEFLLGQESAWNEAFRGLDQSRRMTLHYEDVAENMEGSVTSLLNWLQIADPARPFRPPSTKRQSDAISQEWLERWRRHKLLALVIK